MTCIHLPLFSYRLPCQLDHSEKGNLLHYGFYHDHQQGKDYQSPGLSQERALSLQRRFAEFFTVVLVSNDI